MNWLESDVLLNLGHAVSHGYMFVVFFFKPGSEFFQLEKLGREARLVSRSKATKSGM